MATGLASGQKPTGVTDLDSSQTLSNKTLDSSSVVSGSTVTGASIQSPVRADVKKDTLANLQTYALTASNGQLCFATDAKKMYQVLDAALAEVGSGQGGINYISNPDFELNADGYTGDTNLTITRSTSSPLRGDASGVIAKAAVDASGQVVKIPFTIESADLAKKLYISFDKDASDANYADADLRVEIIKDPNGTPVTIRCNAEDILAGKGTHLAWFQSDASILEYELVFKCNSTNASAYSVKIDNVQVGPREVSYGSAITDWKDFDSVAAGTMIVGSTSNPTYGTVTYNKAMWRRVGSNMEITWNYKQSTSGSAGSGFLYFNIPSGYEIDTDKINSSSAGNSELNSSGVIGQLQLQNGSANGWENIIAVAKVLDSDTIWFMGLSEMNDNGTGGTAPSDPISLTGSVAFSNTYMHANMQVSVPIKGWSSNSIQSEDIGNREVRVRGVGNGGTAITAAVTPIDFTEVEDTTNSWNGTTFTTPETGDYSISGGVSTTASTSSSIAVYIDTTGTGSSYTLNKYIGLNQGAGTTKSFSGTVTLEKGWLLQLRSDNAATLSNSTSVHHIHIQKLAQPQTILETETVAARYTSTSGASITTTYSDFTFEDLDYDTHNMYSGGILTIPITGFYHIDAKVLVAGGSQDARIQLVKNTSTVVTTGVVRSTTTNNALQPSISETLYFEKGETIKFQIYNSLNTNLEVFANFNTFSIARIK